MNTRWFSLNSSRNCLQECSPNALWVKHSQAGTFTVRLDGFIMLYGSAGTNAFTFAWKGPRAPCGAMLPCKSPPDPPERHSVFVV